MGTTITQLSKQEVVNLLLKVFPDPEELQPVIEQVNRWIARGDGIVVYTNQDLGHWNAGHQQFVSFGSPDAMLEVGVDELPTRLPDIGGQINWRYLLTAVYTGEEL